MGLGFGLAACGTGDAVSGKSSALPGIKKWHSNVATKQISIILKNGTKRVVKCGGSQIKDDNVIVYSAVVSMHDVAEQNKFDELLAFNEKRFRADF